tara:strand:- start:8709 stop:9884 length:1176 start_codon:yes stop_codon:yes gene_type:complete
VRVSIYHSHGLKNTHSGERTVALNEFQNLLSSGICTSFHEYNPLPHSANIIRSIYGLTSSFWSFSADRFVTQTINSSKPDIIHFHGIFPYLSISSLRRAHLSGIPVVQTLHNSRWTCIEGSLYRNGHSCVKCPSARSILPGLYHGCFKGHLPSIFPFLSHKLAFHNRQIFHWVDKFIAVSQFIKDVHVQAGFPSHKIIVKPNSCDVPSTQPPLSNRAGIVFIGRLVEAKGVSLLKYVISHLTYPITIVGDGPELSSLIAFCSANQYKHVTFTHALSHHQTLSILASSVLCLVPSICSESFSLVAVESLSLGTPVVASSLGALSSLITDSCGGMLFSHEQPLELLQAINRLYHNPDLASKLGNSGYEYVRSSYNSSLNTSFLISIYSSLLDR